MLIISFTGFIVPSTLLTCATLTILVRSLKSFLYSSIRISPLSFIGITFRQMPFFAACSCHGTMLEWCSMVETITSSPSPINSSANDDTTRFSASVVPLVNITSLVDFALINALTFSRAASCRSVACCDR